MRNIKEHLPLYVSLLLIALFGVLAGGCSTLQNGGKSVVPAVKTATYVGTFYALKEHPEWRPGFELARRELGMLGEAQTIDFTTVLSIVNRLPVEELKSPEATLIITGATILLTEYSGDIIPLDRVEDVRPIVKALYEGVALGLQ